MSEDEREKLLLGKAYVIFVDEIALKLEKLKRLIAEGVKLDTDTRERLRIDMHTMKGGAGIFGLLRISEISGKLEKLFHDAKTADRLSVELQPLFDELQIEVGKMPPPAGKS